MTSSSSTDFTASDGRRFAFPVGGAFLLLAGIFLWRDRATLMWISTTLGGLLVLGGLTVPGRLGPLYDAWMRMALAISRVTTPVFMAVVYFVVLTPTGVLMRLFGRHPIRHSRRDDSFWQRRTREQHSDLRRQF